MGEKKKVDQTSSDTSAAATDDKENENDDGLQKSLDDNLKTMNDLASKEASADNDVNELIKSSGGRKKMKKMMDEYSDEKKKKDDDDEEEGKEEEGKEMKGKKNMKKSLDDIIELNEDVIDAVPFLKSFTKILVDVADKLDSLSGNVSDLQKSQESIFDLQKSFAAVLGGSTKLIKSFSDNVEKIANEAQPLKGKITTADLLKKSFGSDDDGKPKLPSVAVVSEILQKSFQAGEIEGIEISKWEMQNYNPAALSAKALKVVKDNLPEQEVH